MNKKKIIYIAAIVSTVLSICAAILLIYDSHTIDEHHISLLYSICLLVAMAITTILLFWRRYDRYDEYSMYSKSMIKLNKLIQYDKKRKEIEQEIGRLTRELMKSDVSQYIDVNRLAFSGQNSDTIHNTISYDNFLMQFGIQKNTIQIKENTAVFLTPFDESGLILFEECQKILGRVNVFLKQTDNLVEKDDILMNIVSLIVQSELVLVNIDGRNPNVYYELGISHALGKPTILLSKADFSQNDIGFDIRQKRIIIYKNNEDLETQLLYQINRLKIK